MCVYVPADEDEDDVGVRRACEVESCRGVGGAGGGAEGRGVQTLWSLELLRPPPRHRAVPADLYKDTKQVERAAL